MPIQRTRSLQIAATSSLLMAASCILGDFKKGPELASVGGSAGASAGTNASAGATSGLNAGADSSADGGGGASPPVSSCLGMLCETPPKNSCADAGHLTTYDAVGTCSDGECNYTSHTIECECEGDACLTDPCINLVCDTPPGYSCVDIDTERVFAAQGTCDAGSCNYAPTNRACTNNRNCTDTFCQICQQDTACGPDCSPCGGSTPHCLFNGGGSKCTQCNSDAQCGPWYCVDGSCTGKPGCSVGTPGTHRACGDNHATSCCTTETLFPTIAFNRSNDAANAAVLSNFVLGTYEVTVARFRQFVGAFEEIDLGDGVGAGANPNDPSDKGWLKAYASALPATRADLIASLKCDAPNYTWTDDVGVNDTKPINCVNWATAFLFCAWEQSRLPTEAEWNFAAAGGDLQYSYPWGPNAPGPDAKLAAYNGYYYGTSALDGVLDIAPVGEVFGGINRFHLADLSGNVAEWTVDAYGTYPKPCTNCAAISGTATGMKVVRGGSWRSKASDLTTIARGQADATLPASTIGFRCAQ